MNFYVNLINETIKYIENNLHEKISLEDIAAHFCVSKYHFNRMFKTVSGSTLKQYILGRKLTEALKRITEENVSVIDAAYDFGFEYPEVFSRAFKKQFGVSPLACKNEKAHNNLVIRANIIERDIVNYKGNLTLRGTCNYLKELSLEGVFVEVNENSDEFEPLLRSSGENFLAQSQKVRGFKADNFYTVVNCRNEDNGEYTVFYGMEREVVSKENYFQKRIVPEGWYASFIYIGDMFNIRETFVDDLYRWIMIKEVELNSNGVGMINIFELDYLNTKEVQILVPIKKPM